jgi:hypothetical protein
MGDIDLSTDKELITQRECEIQVANMKANFNALKEDTERFAGDIKKQIDKLEAKFWGIIGLLLANLGSIIVLLLKK